MLLAKPSPQVLWYREGKLVDDSYSVVGLNSTKTVLEVKGQLANSSYIYKPFVRVRNELHLAQPLRRSQLFQRFQCVAFNTRLVPAAEMTVHLDLLCKCQRSKLTN